MPLIDPLLLKSRLGPLAGRFDVDALTECDSTNSELMRRAAAGAPSGTVIVADSQHAGRGRRGRTWLSGPAEGLMFSLLWRHVGPPARIGGLSLAVGVALDEALTRLGARDVFLKWPNDLLLRQGEGFAKLGGILIELASDRRGMQAVIGIGLNLQQPSATLPQATAGLIDALPQLPERHDLLAVLLTSLAEVLDRFAVDGFAALKTRWETLHAWQGKAVELSAGPGEMPLVGECDGVDEDGALRLLTAQGVQRVLAGDLSLRLA